ncbi:MAG: signal recognition particle-docking protein FtsY, partial [Nitrospinota bacterium]
EEAGMGSAPPPPSEPWVIMVAGVNGSGKTTTAGKLAHRFRQEGKRVLMAAADTFRAAASEQLEVWAERAGSEMVRHRDGADPSAVVYDAIEAARARGCQVVIADTAGRLHTKRNLMEELKKVKRVTGKLVPGAPHEVLLVLDATTGQNALAQARLFGQEVGVTGIALTKLDGTAKGGIAVAVARETGIPIKFVGVGEGIEDLKEFHPESFVRALFED